MKHQSKGFLVFVLLCCMIALAVPCAWAQIYSGSMTGVVTDPSGAVVPGASIADVDDGLYRALPHPLPASVHLQVDRGNAGIQHVCPRQYRAGGQPEFGC